MSGAEGWNCIETNAIVFFSQNYSFRIMTQAAGRIDRLDTKFVDLYFYKFIVTVLLPTLRCLNTVKDLLFHLFY